MNKRLKELRKEKGLTQVELAKILNTNQSQYGKYENGKTNLSIKNSKKLADYFGVPVSYLLGIDNERLYVYPERDFPIEKPTTRIAMLLSKSKKTLKVISKEVGINYETLSAYKRQVRFPKKENAQRLADYFGVSVPYLLGFDEDKLAKETNKLIILDELNRIRSERKLLLEQLLALDKEEAELLNSL